ncbi:hypothetical protein [Neolewinella sp.]|uniref:hypothetical protein n=1 Tax=Neolewinella sp. TaxID=2993543 RepID=UPI003B515AA6
MTIEQERLEAIRALTRIEDAALIRRVRRLIAPDYFEDSGNSKDLGQTKIDLVARTAIADAKSNQPSIDLSKYTGRLAEKVDLDKLRAEQRPQKLDVEAFNKAADAIEWEHTIEELLAMLD